MQRVMVRYDSQDAFTHYVLGLSYAHQAVANNDRQLCAPAIEQFETMLDLNPDLEEAAFARKNIQSLQACVAKP